MAPSPAAGRQSTGAPKTPTKLTRKPGQTPQRSGQASKPTPSTPKGSQATRPETGSPTRPARDFGDKAQDTAEEAQSQIGETDDKAEDQAQQSQTGDDDDEGPMSKVTEAGQQSSQEGLEQQAPEPVADEEEEEDTVEGAQAQGEDAADVTGEEGEDIDDNATEKAGETVQSADDDESEQSQQQGAGGRSLLGKAQQVGGKAQQVGGKAQQVTGKATKDPKAAAKDAPGDVKEEAEGTTEDAQETAPEGVDEAQKVAGDAGDQAEGVADQAKDAADEAQDTAQDTAEDAQETAEGVQETTEGAAEQGEDAVEDVDGEGRPDTNGIQVPEGLPVDLSVLKGLEVGEDGTVLNREGNPIGKLAEGDAEDLAGYPIGDDGEILDDDGDLVGRVELMPDEIKKQLQEAQEQGEELPEGAEEFLSQYQGDVEGVVDGMEEYADNLPSVSILEGLTCQVDGLIYDSEGNTVGRVTDGDPQELQNAVLNDEGEFVDQDGNVVGHAEIHEDAEELVQQGIYEPATQAQEAVEDADEEADQQVDGADEDVGDAADAGEDVKEAAQDGVPTEIEDQLPGIEALQGRELNNVGEILDEEGNVLGGIEDESLRQKIAEGEIDPNTLKVDEEGNVLDDEGNVLGKTELAEGAAEKLAEAHKTMLDFRILDGRRINKKGKIIDDDGDEIGELTDGDLSQCAGARANEKGEVFNKAGELVGHVRVVPGEAAENATRELLEELGELPEEVEEAAEEEPQLEEPSLSILDGLKVNKKGQVLDEDGEPIGELTAGELSACAGKKINATGEVLDKDGNVIGHVRTLPQEVQQKTAPLSILEGLKVNKKGQVLNEDGEPIGELTSGEIAQAAGKKINAQGEVLDNDGNVIGTVRTLPVEGEEEQAEEQGEEEEAEEQDEEGEGAEEGEDATQLPPLSALEGLTVNKAGKIIDQNGAIIGELVEGDAKKLSKAGITADAEGQFWDNKGHVIGRAKTLPQEEAEEEAPFAGLEGLRVVEDGWVQDEEGNTVGYITEGDAKKLIGRLVDEDGDIIDKKGSVVGHAERYIPEEDVEAQEEKPDLSFLKGKTVTKAGLVIGDEGIPVAKLVEGSAKELTGRQLDAEGQFWNDTGSVIGRIELIPEEEREAKPEGPFAGLDDLRVIEGGKIADEDGNVVGEIVEGNPKRLVGLSVDEDGDIVDKYGNVKGHAEPLPEKSLSTIPFSTASR